MTNVTPFNRKVSQTVHLIILTWTILFWLDQRVFMGIVKELEHILSNLIEVRGPSTCLNSLLTIFILQLRNISKTKEMHGKTIKC